MAKATTTEATIATLGHSINVVGVPTGLLASAAFNDFPVALHIGGVRETNASLFAMLSSAATMAEAARTFQDYMDVVFGLDLEQRRPVDAQGRRRFRSSYLRLIKGWGFDSSGPEGAVLKGWVESRFGLFPTHHKTVIEKFSSPAWARYVEEKMSSRFHNNAILAQLDLLYEFCQFALARFHPVARRHIRLYRGVNGFAEHRLVERIDKRTAVVRLNSLTSFTSNRIVADEFGDTILEASVPLVKIVFFRDLLLDHPLDGEGEYLVIGGDYRVRISTL